MNFFLAKSKSVVTTLLLRMYAYITWIQKELVVKKPTKFTTSLRVLLSRSGHVLCAISKLKSFKNNRIFANAA